MPELPEVETIRRDLQNLVVGLSVESVRVRRSDLLCQTPPEDLIEMLTGRCIEDVDRRGKNLILWFSGAATLIVRLHQTGQFYVVDAATDLPEHTHVIFELSAGYWLIFRCIRCLLASGYLELVAGGELWKSAILEPVGLDALSPQFTADKLRGFLQGRRRLVKTALLDQRRLAGLGNIYVCEGLHRAGISPELPCNELTHEQLLDLHAAITDVLSEAVQARGTTLRDGGYLDGIGEPGHFQEKLRVYEREALGCIRPGCGHAIKRIKQENRSTYYCPGCQAR